MHWFPPENAPKAFGGWALPGPAGGAYSTPADPVAEFKGGKMDGKGKRTG